MAESLEENEFLQEIAELKSSDPSSLDHKYVTKAVQEGCYKALEILIEYLPPEKLVEDCEGIGAVHCAGARDDGGRALALLLPHLSDSQLVFKWKRAGCIPLHLATTPEAIDMLVKRMSDEDLLITDDEGKTPLGRAIASRGTTDLSMVKAFTPQQLLVPQTSDGRTALHLAAYQSAAATVKALVEKVPELVSVKSDKGNTALATALWTAQFGQSKADRQCVEQLLMHTTQKELTERVGNDDPDNLNVLHLAAACPTAVAMAVIDAVTDDSAFGVQYAGGKTVLHIAVETANRAAKPLPFSDEKPEVDTTVIRALAWRMSAHDKSLRHEGKTAAELASELGRTQIAEILSSIPKKAL